MAEPSSGLLRRFLEQHPAAEPRIARAVGSLLAVGLLALAALGFLIIWHLIRRGRLIREGLPPPRPVRLPDLDLDLGEGKGKGVEPDDPQAGDEPTSRSESPDPKP